MKKKAGVVADLKSQHLGEEGRTREARMGYKRLLRGKGNIQTKSIEITFQQCNAKRNILQTVFQDPGENIFSLKLKSSKAISNPAFSA